MCTRRRVDGTSRPARSPIQLIPAPAQYSGLPKRTSRGTSSASAAENFIAEGTRRLRGAVKAAADAAIATITTECLSILKRMSRAATRFCSARQLHHRFGLCPAKLCELIVRVQSDRSQASRGRGLRANGCRKTSVLNPLLGARAPPGYASLAIDLIARLIAANFALDQRHMQEYTYRTSAVHILLLIARRVRNKPHNARPAQLALRQRLGIERSSILVQQGTALVAHRLDCSLAAQFKKLM